MLRYVVYVCLAILAIYLAGQLITALCLTEHGKPFRTHFTKLASGATALTLIYAALMTAGQTILLSLLLVGCYALAVHVRSHGFSGQRVARNLMVIEPLPLCLTCVVAMCLCYLQYRAFIDPASGTLYAMHPDHTFYARIAQYLNRCRIENSSLDWIFPHDQAPSPYHYLEIWMTACASKLFAANAVYASRLIVLPVLLSLIYTGAIALLERWYRVSWRTYAIGGLIFFTASFALLFHRTLIHVIGGDVHEHTVASLPKLAFIYLYLMWAMIAFQESNMTPAVVVLAALGIIYPLILPSVYVATIAALWFAYARRHVRWGRAVSLSMLMGSIVLYVLVFYSQAQSRHSYALLGSTQAATEYYQSARALVTAINILGSTSIKMLVTNAPYLLFIGLALTQIRVPWRTMTVRPATLFCLLLFTLPLCMWSALHFLFDSVQFWYLLYFPMIGIASYVLIGATLQQVRCAVALRVFALVLVVANIHQHPLVRREGALKRPFYTAIARTVAASPQAHFAYLKAADDYRITFDKSPTFIVPLHMLTAYTETYLPVSLSVHDTPLSTSIYARHRERSVIEASPFYRFVEQQKANRAFVSIADSQVEFIKAFDIHYLILSKQAQPSPMLRALFDTIIEDEDNSYQFIQLNI